MRFKMKASFTSEDGIYWKINRLFYLSSTVNLKTLKLYESATLLENNEITEFGINENSTFQLIKGSDKMPRKKFICKSCNNEFYANSYRVEYCDTCTNQLMKFYNLVRDSKNREEINND